MKHGEPVELVNKGHEPSSSAPVLMARFDVSTSMVVKEFFS